MANIIISTLCNRSCSYCFAPRPAKNPNGHGAFISTENFRKALDFVCNSGMDQIRLLGGEPSLHPDFPELINLSLERNRKIVLFTNGLMPEKSISALDSVRNETCQIIMNVNSPNARKRKEEEWQLESIRRLGKKVTFGYNIHRLPVNMAFLLEIFKKVKYSTKPAIRIGLAQPIIQGSNSHINPKYYNAVGKEIVQFAQQSAKEGITLSLDCGFVPCMFGDYDIEFLKSTGVDFGWHCNPILDIRPDLMMTHCFPLHEFYPMPLQDFSIATDARNRFETITKLYRVSGIYRNCTSCKWKQNSECRGGCLSHILMKFRPASFRISLNEKLMS